MTLSPQQFRRRLIAGSIIAVAVALVLATTVIPPVRQSTSPDITPDTAVPAFWVVAGLHLLAAAALLLTSMVSRARRWTSTSVLVIAGIALLIFGVTLIDAAFAVRAAGPSLRLVAVLLFLCTAADALAGALALATAFLRPKPTG